MPNDVKYTTTSQVTESTVTFRIRAMLPLRLHLPYCATDGEVSVVTMFEMNSLCQKLRSKAAHFRVDNTSVLLRHLDLSHDLSHDSDKGDTVLTFKKRLTADDRRKRRIDKFKEFYPVSYYEKLTEANVNGKAKAYSPIIRCDIDTFKCVTTQSPIDVLCVEDDSLHFTYTFKCVTMQLPIDVLCVVEDSLLMSKLTRVLSEAVCEQLHAMQYSFITYGTPDTFLTPEVFHFKPPTMETLKCQTYILLVKSELTTETQRRDIHTVLSLPLTRPLLRPHSAHHFNPCTHEGYLISPHTYIAPNLMKGSRVSLVQGDYSYHHYMQDKFDDNKWGCAYRSLQTLVSWFRMQGYTETDVPSHIVIQQALCDMGDKTASFVGSRKWIGSFEVGMCLDRLLGVESRFISVSRGEDLVTKGRELAVHFETHGSPLMIGGGVLAHTILGVDFNEETGDTRFLILDPHYTGDEDIKTIIDKGWCGWKTGKFWDQNAMYNICMPLPPQCV